MPTITELEAHIRAELREIREMLYRETPVLTRHELDTIQYRLEYVSTCILLLRSLIIYTPKQT